MKTFHDIDLSNECVQMIYFGFNNYFYDHPHDNKILNYR